MTTSIKSSRTSRKSAASRVSSASVNVASVEISAPSGSGLSDGSTSPVGGSLSSPSVGGDGMNKGKGRNNGEDQINAAVTLENLDKSPKGVLRSRLSAAFRAPSFPDDLDEWEAARLKLVDSGDITREEYEDMRNKKIARFRSSQTAPVYSYDLLCKYVRDNLVQEWAKYCPFMAAASLGDGALSVGVVWDWTGNNNDVPTSSPLAKDCTLSDVITAVLSCAVYAEGMAAYNNRKNAAAADGYKKVREGVRMLLGADVLGTDIISGLTELVGNILDERKKVAAQIAALNDEIAAKEMENALASLLHNSADIRLRSFRGGLSDYELELVGLRGWSSARMNNVITTNNASIAQKRAEIARLESTLN